MSQKTVLYQGVGNKLTQWAVDVEAATLTPVGLIELPSNVQYAWPNAARDVLYVTTSDAASGNAPNPGSVHRLCAVQVAASGAMSLLGPPAALPQRPIHNSLDRSGRYALTCYNKKSDLTVHRINDDGSVGEEVRQASELDRGIFAHQIIPTPDNRAVIMVTRGNRAESGKAEEPGALMVYGFDAEAGRLAPLQNLEVGGRGGLGYGPRHVDFHPAKPWVYVSVETQNEIHMHQMEGACLSPEPLFKLGSTAGPTAAGIHQLGGGIHVHPKGHAVYMSNRASDTVAFNGKRVFAGGENNIAVFRIDPETGAPALLQHADPECFHVRTFSIDPTGRLMVAASIAGMTIREGDGVREVPAALSVFRIGDEGRLSFVRKYDVDVGAAFQWWTGLVALP